ncbi:MAG: hypothetical protein R2780_10820 [Crocinitomicaceae bacterium]|nr:hypothetical protein [Crocinitomicaceae bacterium]
MKKLIPVLFLLILVLSSCGKSYIEEGEITYDITYPNMEVTGIMSAILPKEMTIVFKGTKMKTTIARGKIFNTEVITDESNESIEMRLDFGDKKYYCILTPDEVKELKASAPKYNIKATEEQDSINGVWAKKYLVTSEDSLQPGDAWFTEDLKVQSGAWFSAYSTVIGMPIIYDVERYGLMMHVESNSFIQREVKDTEFDRDPDLRQVDFKTYESEVQELFDILLE